MTTENINANLLPELKLSEIIYNNEKPNAPGKYFNGEDRCCALGAVIEKTLPELAQKIINMEIEDYEDSPQVYEKLSVFFNFHPEISEDEFNSVCKNLIETTNPYSDSDLIRKLEEIQDSVYYRFQMPFGQFDLFRFIIYLNDTQRLTKKQIGSILMALGL